MKLYRSIIFWTILIFFLIYIPRLINDISLDLQRAFLNGNHYSWLSQGFLNGNLFIDLPQKYYFDDLIWLNRKIYIAMAPMPAILIMPIVKLIGPKILAQGIISLLATITSINLIQKILKKQKISSEFRFIFILWFLFGSFYFFPGLRISVWGIQHTVAITFILGSIYLLQEKKSLAAIIILLVASVLSRYPMFIYLPLILLIYHQQEKKINFSKIILPLAIVILGLSIIFTYNYLRFANIFEFGYNLFHSQLYPLKAYAPFGLNSLNYLPQNLIGLFLYPPLPIIFFRGFLAGSNWYEYFRFIEPYPSIFLTGIVPIYLFFQTYKKDFLYFTSLITTIVFLLLVITRYRLEPHYLVDAIPAILLLDLVRIDQNKKSKKTFFYLSTLAIVLNIFWYLANLNYYW